MSGERQADAALQTRQADRQADRVVGKQAAVCVWGGVGGARRMPRGGSIH